MEIFCHPKEIIVWRQNDKKQKNIDEVSYQSFLFSQKPRIFVGGVEWLFPLMVNDSPVRIASLVKICSMVYKEDEQRGDVWSVGMFFLTGAAI